MRYAIQQNDGSFQIDFIGALFPQMEFALDWQPTSKWLAKQGVYPVVDDLPAQSGTMVQAIEPVLKDGVVHCVQRALLPLATLQERQALQINSICSAAICAGFSSDALGQNYLYPSAHLDQINLSSNVTASLLPNLARNWTVLQMCANSAGLWLHVAHSAEQIQAVAKDFQNFKTALLTKNAALQAQINAATSADDLLKITW